MNPEQQRQPANQNPARILVVLPTLGDRLESLEETLASIEQQRLDVSLRLVVIVPQSAKAARQLASSYSATIVDDPKKGISEAINRGLAERCGEEFYAWMGDDDLFRPGGLWTLQHLLDTQTDAVVAYGACDYINSNGKILITSKAGKFARFLLPWGPDLIPHPGSMIRLDELAAIGLFDSSLKYAMDLDVFLKLRKRGKFACTKRPVSAFRWHPDSLTVSNRRDSSLESEALKSKHSPTFVRPFTFIWKYPVRWASAFAARRVGKRAL